MSPPIQRESYVAALMSLRGLLTAAQNTQDPKGASVKGFQAILAAAEIIENIVVSIGAVEDKVETWESAAPRQYGQKPLSESKCDQTRQNSRRGMTSSSTHWHRRWEHHGGSS